MAEFSCQMVYLRSPCRAIKLRSLTHPVDDAITLLTQGGRLTCKFRLSGALTNNQFGLGFICIRMLPFLMVWR